MKNFPLAVLGALLCTASIAPASAQTFTTSSDQSVPQTRASVEADLAAWRAAGFRAPINYEHYPANAQAAGRIVAEQRAKSLNTPQ